ncbi:MAG: hypothetical protein ABJN52_00275 [Litorimonas sp.]
MLELHHRTPTKLVVGQLYRNFRAAPAIQAKFPSYHTGSDPYVMSIFLDANDLEAVERRVDNSELFSAVRKGLSFARFGPVAV